MARALPADPEEETRRAARGAPRIVRQDEDVPLSDVAWMRDSLSLRLAGHLARSEEGDAESRRTLRRLMPLLDRVKRECAVREAEEAAIGDLRRFAAAAVAAEGART